MKQCVCTTTFAVLVSGRPQGGWIHPQRGIRQGCPLAPLLFILASDTLAICTEQLCIQGYLAGFQTTGRPGGIPLLQYAYDTTFFLRGSTVVAHLVSTMIEIYSDFLGLQLNRGKSSAVGCRHRIVLGGIRPNICGTGHTRRLAPYPIPWASSNKGKTPRSRLAAGNGEDRGSPWGMAGSASLSRGSYGVVAIRTGGHPHIFYGHFFWMPDGVQRQIEGIMRRFFWQGARPSETKGVALVAWRTVCR